MSKELKKKLILLNTVYAGGWECRTLIRDMYWAGKLTMTDFKWGSRFENENLDMYNPIKALREGAEQGFERAWSTFSERVKAKIYVKNNRICIDLTLENGNSYDGHKTGVKWSATFIGFPTEKLGRFRHNIEGDWNRYLSYIFEEEEQIRMEKRMTEISKDLLK